MSDSIEINVWINPDLTVEEYERCQFPSKDLNDTDETSADFRMQYPTSPLTGSLFKVTALGIEIPVLKGKRKKRKKYGRIVGYEVSVNVPACAIGHNRLLVNGVFQAARAAYWLLRSWLARNGCTQEGLDNIDLANADIVDLTLTFLYLFESETAARAALYEFRMHSETLLNKKGHKGREVAFSRPPKPVPTGPDSEQNYTSYIRLRDMFFSAYVKPLHQPKAFLLPLADDALEAEVQEKTVRTLRVENRVHGKWLQDNELNKVANWNPQNWEDDADPYEKVFNLLRTTLRLDEKIRTKRLKRTSIPDLKLGPIDKKLLEYHLDGGVVRDHEVFRDMPEPNRSKYYSAISLRVFDEVQIDFEISYANRGLLSPTMSKLLVYQGEFQPDWEVPGDYLGGYMSSRVSLPVAVAKVIAIVADVMKYGPDCVPPLPDRTIFNGPAKRKRTNSVGDARLPPTVLPDELIEVDGELLVI